MTRIEDGGGKNGFANVSNTQRLDVSSRSAARAYYESRDEGQVYTVTVEDAGAVADEETLYIKNTSTTKDIIIVATIITCDVSSRWRLKFVTNTSTVAGTVITPTNLNKSSSNAAAAEVRGGATGVTNLIDAGTIGILQCPAGGTVALKGSEGLRLGQNDAIAIECETSGDVTITITFEYDSE